MNLIVVQILKIIIRIQLNYFSSSEVGYYNGLPAPLEFPFYAFPPLNPSCLIISGGPVLQIEDRNCR